MLVAILGASENPDRYSNKAQKMLLEYGHQVIPVTPNYASVLGEPALDSLAEIKEFVDTVTVYLRPDLQPGIVADLLALKPLRAIFNPGSENPSVEAQLEAAGIEVERACTLVLLRTDQFAPAAGQPSIADA